MQNKYVLEINNVNLTLPQIEDILNIKFNNFFTWKSKTDFNKNVFSFTVMEEENDSYFNYISYFLDIIDNCYQQLNAIGITKNDITIWRYFKYFEQCNMEFNPLEMKRL